MRRDDGPHRTGIGGDEERRAHALDERDHRDQPERIRVQGDDDNEDAHSDDAHGIRTDHQPLPVPAVGHDPCRQREERVRDRPREEDEAGFGRRAREREHEQRIGDRRQPRPDVGEQLPGLEQHEVAVTAQGNRVHGMTLPGVAAACPRLKPEEGRGRRTWRERRGVWRAQRPAGGGCPPGRCARGRIQRRRPRRGQR